MAQRLGMYSFPHGKYHLFWLCEIWGQSKNVQSNYEATMITCLGMARARASSALVMSVMTSS